MSLPGRLYKADLNGANLSGANLRDADLNTALLDRAVLVGAECSSETNLGGARLVYADFSGVNLNGVRFTEANLNGANLSGAHLVEANSATASPSMMHDRERRPVSASAISVRQNDIYEQMRSKRQGDQGRGLAHSPLKGWHSPENPASDRKIHPEARIQGWRTA